MTVKVSLYVYSGRENPAWELSGGQADELRDRIGNLTRTSLEKAPGQLGGLGYQGFEITAEREAGLEPRIFVHADVVDLGGAKVSLRDQGGSLERWLLSTAGDEVVDGELRAYVERQLPPPPAYAGRPGAAARVRLLEVPRYEPSVWNDDPNVRDNNNCYNYANNKATSTFAQPGRGSGTTLGAITVAAVAEAAVRDGLERLAQRDAPQETPIDGHFVALVIWPDRDFHWYRLDDTTQWSHKPGPTDARDHDNDGQKITDPLTCSRDPYTEFGGFFQTFPNRIQIR